MQENFSNPSDPMMKGRTCGSRRTSEHRYHTSEGVEQEQAKMAESAANLLQDNDDEFPGILGMRLDTELDEDIVLPETLSLEMAFPASFPAFFPLSSPSSPPSVSAA